MSDETDSGEESDVDSILNDCDTEFVIDKPISKQLMTHMISLFLKQMFTWHQN